MSTIKGTIPSSDLALLAGSGLLIFWVIDTTAMGGNVMRLYNGKNELGNDVVWQGNTYNAFPIAGQGFDFKGDGPQARPKLTVGDLDGSIGALVRLLGGIEGAVVTRKRTFVKYVDAVNFAAGNASANPTIAFADQIYRIEQKEQEVPGQFLTFTLASPLDREGVKVPRRQFRQNLCAWAYKGPDCGYVGALATCDKGLNTTNGCAAHFGATAVLPAGLFPSVGLVDA
jgi:lambda family phage minor tail protein L